LEEIVETAIAPLSVRQLMWHKFKRNRLAVIGAILLIIIYSMAAFAGFLSPYALMHTHDAFAGVGPNSFHIFDKQGKAHWPPFVYGYKATLDPKTYKRTFTINEEERYPLRFFAKGDSYTLLLWKTDVHLFVVDDPAVVFVVGTDPLGRDYFTRILYGGQVSLTIGLVGVFLSLVIGSLAGVAAGYFGGIFDNIMMRLVEVLMAFPRIPLWMALAGALPANIEPLKVYFGITLVLSIVNWGGLARQVRSKVLALRELDYVMAARLGNASTPRILARHLFPNTLSHVIVVATLAIPGMILGETALSFLGLGIRPPMTSWGLLLSDAQQLQVLLQKPWLLWPIVPVMITAISFNLVGDGLRDAADPFAAE
jgi:peptide/nickel transport system permease protein